MITTTLYGGLGNQMFLYAAVRAISLRNHVPMAFNTTLGFRTDKLYRRHLELVHLNVKLPEGGASVFNVPLARLWRKISQKVGRNVLMPHYKMVREWRQNLRYDLTEKPLRNAYLEGYWQSECYFKDFEEQIREDFRIMTPMPRRTRDELKRIQALGGNTVMIGIRRYQECTAANRMQVLSKEYYDRAIAIAREKVENPVFVVFCQERQWAMDNIRIDGAKVYFVESKDGPLATIEDLWLMTHLRHFIISNSTFYWWGAWLATGEDKLVIAPSIFPHPRCVCDDWIKITQQ